MKSTRSDGFPLTLFLEAQTMPYDPFEEPIDVDEDTGHDTEVVG